MTTNRTADTTPSKNGRNRPVAVGPSHSSIFPYIPAKHLLVKLFEFHEDRPLLDGTLRPEMRNAMRLYRRMKPGCKIP